MSLTKNDSFFQIIKENCPKHAKKFSQTEMDCIEKMYKKDENAKFLYFSDKDTKEYCETANTSNAVQTALAKHPLTPYRKSILQYFMQSDICKEAMKELLKREEIVNRYTCASLLSKISDITMDDIIFSSKDSEKRPMGGMFFNIIVENHALNCIKKGNSGDLTPGEVYSFLYTDSLKTGEIFTYKDVSIPEIFPTLIASNSFLDEDIRNRAFDEGCDWEKLKGYTPYMIEEMFDSVLDMMKLDQTTLSDKELEQHNIACVIMRNWTWKNLLNENQQCQIINGLKDENLFKNPSYRKCVKNILEKTTYPEVMELFDKIDKNKLKNEKRFVLYIMNNSSPNIFQFQNKMLIKIYDDVFFDKTPNQYYLNILQKAITNTDVGTDLFRAISTWKNENGIGAERENIVLTAFKNPYMPTSVLKEQIQDMEETKTTNTKVYLFACISKNCNEDVLLKDQIFSILSRKPTILKYNLNVEKLKDVLMQTLKNENINKHSSHKSFLENEIKNIEKTIISLQLKQREMEMDKIINKLSGLDRQSITDFYLSIEDTKNKYEKNKEDQMVLKDKIKEIGERVVKDERDEYEL